MCELSHHGRQIVKLKVRSNNSTLDGIARSLCIDSGSTGYDSVTGLKLFAQLVTLQLLRLSSHRLSSLYLTPGF